MLAGGVIAHRLSKETRQRVEAAARELGYRPNLVARTLRTRRSSTIALLVSDIANPFFARLASLIEQRLHAHGYSLMLCNTGDEPKREAAYLHLLDQKAIDGLILVPVTVDRAELLQKISRHVPLVILHRPIAGIAATVADDPPHTATHLCQTLYQGGVRRVALVSGPSHVTTHDIRARLIREHFDVAAEYEGPALRDTGRKAHDEFARRLSTPPDAIICTSIALTHGVMEAMAAAEMKHPGPVMGTFDEVPMMHLMPLPIVCSVQDVAALAEGCVTQLLPLLPGRSVVGADVAAQPKPMIFPARIVSNPAFEIWKRQRGALS